MSEAREFTAMRRAIALGRINAFSDEAVRLAELVRRGVLDHGPVVDALWDAANAHDFPEQHGVDFVQMLLADAFGHEQPAPQWLVRAA